jgi:predicted  nucleic acid-binding Zn-ribbon protein
LIELQETLRKAENSLTSLEQSFQDYRKQTDATIAGIKAQRNILLMGIAAGGILAAFLLL